MNTFVKDFFFFFILYENFVLGTDRGRCKGW